MKNTFSARRFHKPFLMRSFFGIALCAAMLLFILLRILAPDIFFSTFAPAMRFGNTASDKTAAFFDAFVGAVELAQEYDALFAEHQTLVRENARLAEALGTYERLSGEGIVAGVVARPPQSPYDTLLIGKGSEDGVAVGMEAFAAGGTPVGFVTEVWRTYARITLFSSSGARMEGWAGGSRAPLTLLGEGGGAFRAHMSKTSGITRVDAVYVPGPGALRVGTVAEIEGDALSSAAKLSITPLVNPFSITTVELRETGATLSVEEAQSPEMP